MNKNLLLNNDEGVEQVKSNDLTASRKSSTTTAYNNRLPVDVLEIIASYTASNEVDLYHLEMLFPATRQISEPLWIKFFSIQYSYVQPNATTNTSHSYDRSRSIVQRWRRMETILDSDKINKSGRNNKWSTSHRHRFGLALPNSQENHNVPASVATLRGRDYAKNASFTKARSKEAREIIYELDKNGQQNQHHHLHPNAIALRKQGHDNVITMKKNDTDDSNEEKTEKIKFSSVHWRKWNVSPLLDVARRSSHYGSNNSIQVFVELHLRDGTNRSWRGFRTIQPTSSITHDLSTKLRFTMEWKVAELVNDITANNTCDDDHDNVMNWSELGEYCEFHLPEYYRSQQARKELQTLMEPLQLTITLNGRLIMATGGCAGDMYCLSPSASFQFRHPKYCLAENSMGFPSTGEEVGGIYKASMSLDGESPPSFGGSWGATYADEQYRGRFLSCRCHRRNGVSLMGGAHNRNLTITCERICKDI